MPGRPLWSGGLVVTGLAVSAYLVATHYFAGQVPLACASGGVVDCESVTSSAQSMVGPFPVALLGLVWFVGFAGILVVRQFSSDDRLILAQVVWATGGLLMIFYLVYAELFLIGAICLWCTAVHAIVVGLFLLTIWDATAPSPADEGYRLRSLG